MFKLSSLAILSVLSVFTVIAPAQAGYQYDYHKCVRNSDGSGACWGNMRAFRNSSNPNDYTTFDQSTGSPRQFNAVSEGVYYYCVVQSSNYTINGMWPTAVLHQGYFIINWDANKNCVALTMRGGSMY